MTPESNASRHLHGFVAWLDAADESLVREPATLVTDGVGQAVVGEGFGLVSRPRGSAHGRARSRIERTAGHVRDLAVSWGWIAHRSEVAERLGKPELADASDEDLLLAAYRRWGAGLAKHLEGELSWLVVDRARGVVVAGRDALGLRGCYTLRQDRRTWIASHLELLFAVLGQTPRLEVAALSRTLRHGVHLDDPGATIYRGVRQIPPGHAATFRPGRAPRLKRWWQPERHGEIRPGTLDGGEADELYLTVLKRAVEGALPAGGSILAELSGDLDSASVVALAAELLEGRGERDRLHAVSVVQPSLDLDVSCRRDLVRALHLSHTTLELDETVRLDRLVGRADPGRASPGRSHSTRPGTQTLSSADRRRLAALGGHVCLTGQACRSCPAAGPWPTGQRGRWRRALPGTALGRRPSLLELLRTSLRRGSQESPPPPWLIMETGASASRPSRRPARRGLYPSLLTLLDPYDDPRETIDHRAPLLDRTLVELTLHLPWDGPLPAARHALMRRALGDRLPESLLQRQHPGNAASGMVRHFRALLDSQPRIRQGRWLADLGVLDPGLYAEALDRAVQGHVDPSSHPLLTAATYELWLHANRGLPNLSLTHLDPLAQWTATSHRMGRPADLPEVET